MNSFAKHTAAAILALPLATLGAQAKELTFGYAGDLKSLDPHSLSESFTLSMANASYEGLVRRNSDMEIVPALATSWEILDPTHWRFHLREGVTFHNGNPFNADDVIFSAERVRADGSDLKYRIPAEAVFTKVDDYTVDVELPSPNPILHYQWAGWYIMDKEWSEEHDVVNPSPVNADAPSHAALHANGTGPFKVEAHQPGVETTWVPNDTWWDTAEHNLTRVKMTTIGSDPTRVAALLSGQVDWIAPVPAQDIERIAGNNGTHMLQGPDLRTMYLGFDTMRDELIYSNVKGKNPFKDARVRKAVMHAVDVDAIAEKIMRGGATPASLMIAPSLFSGSDAFKRLPYDPEAAKALLAEAGYPDGFEVTLDCSNNRYPNDERICQAIVGMLGRAGITTTLNAQPKAQYFSRILAGGGYDTSFFMLGWSPAVMDSIDLLSNVLACRDAKGNGGTMNIGGYCNPELESLRDEIRVETDAAKRDDMIAKAWTIVMDDMGYVPLFQGSLAWGVRDGVNVLQSPDEDFNFSRVTID